MQFLPKSSQTFFLQKLSVFGKNWKKNQPTKLIVFPKQSFNNHNIIFYAFCKNTSKGTFKRTPPTFEEAKSPTKSQSHATFHEPNKLQPQSHKKYGNSSFEIIPSGAEVVQQALQIFCSELLLTFTTNFCATILGLLLRIAATPSQNDNTDDDTSRRVFFLLHFLLLRKLEQ